ncbi:MAG: hypothetical protein ACRDUY_09930 [Nitriliruptorales bacterium]
MRQAVIRIADDRVSLFVAERVRHRPRRLLLHEDRILPVAALLDDGRMAPGIADLVADTIARLRAVAESLEVDDFAIVLTGRVSRNRDVREAIAIACGEPETAWQSAEVPASR